MATFRIHEDFEKENKGANNGTAIGLKGDKRTATVFGILDNKLSKNVPKVDNIKNQVGKYIDENVYNKHVVGKPGAKSDTIVNTEQYKAFSVYEDPGNTTDNPEDKENLNETAASNNSIISVGGIRCVFIILIIYINSKLYDMSVIF